MARGMAGNWQAEQPAPARTSEMGPPPPPSLKLTKKASNGVVDRPSAMAP